RHLREIDHRLGFNMSPLTVQLSTCSFFYYCYGPHRDLHSFPTRRSSDLIADIKVRNAPEHPEESRIERALRGRQARELEDFEEDVPGTIVRARVDRDHPLGFGVGTSDGALYVLHSGGAVFEPDENFETAAYFPDALEKVSGVISERNLQRLSNASWLANRRVGSGRVILFADDPLFRH